MEQRWMKFANLGLIRLNQSADDGGSSSSTSTQSSDGDADDLGQDAQDDGTNDTGDSNDDAQDDDQEPKAPETLEEYQAALAQVQADKEAVERVRRSLDRRSKKDAKKIAELEAKVKDTSTSPDGDNNNDFDPEAERDRIRAELAVETGHERARLKAEAMLSSKVSIKPERAVVLLGDELKDAVGDDGTVDVEAITDLVDKLLEDNPGLKVARGDVPFQGNADGGVREATRVSEEQQIQDEITKAQKDGKFERVISLKQRLAAIQKTKKKG